MKQVIYRYIRNNAIYYFLLFAESKYDDAEKNYLSFKQSIQEALETLKPWKSSPI